jgi:flagellar biosynthesis GTPase FlhF
MRSHRRLSLLLAGLPLLLSTACITPLMMESATVPLGGRAYKVLGETEAERCLVSILGIPIERDASLHSTLAAARDAIGADALVAVTVDRRQLTTGFYNESCTLVRAKGIRFTDDRAPFLQPGPAVPPVPPKSPPSQPAAEPGAPAAEPAAEPVAEPAAEPAAAERRPATRAERERQAGAKKRRAAEKRRQARLEKKRRAEEKKRQAREKKRQAALEKKRRAEEEKRRAAEAERKAEEEKRKAEEKRRKAEEAKRKAEAERRRAEEARPVPEQYAIFCKYEAGQPILVETKADKIEADFVKCVYFGVRVKKADGSQGVIPFEKIWSVRMRADDKAQPAGPAKPRR